MLLIRILRAQPKKVRYAIIFYVRKGAWYPHPECLILSLLASPIMSERKFAINQVLKLRGGREFGDNSLRPRITPKLKLSATSLTTLISWEGNVQEPSFTCSLSTSEILGFEQTPDIPPKLYCHSQSTERFYSFFISFTSLNVFPQSCEAGNGIGSCCSRPGSSRWFYPSKDTSSG